MNNTTKQVILEAIDIRAKEIEIITSQLDYCGRSCDTNCNKLCSKNLDRNGCLHRRICEITKEIEELEQDLESN